MRKSVVFSQVSAIGLAIALLGLGAAPHAWSQSTAGFDPTRTDAPLTAASLEILVGPIALYADDLVGVVLPASTYPLQIVQASRFLDALAQDSSLQPDSAWDSSVIALLNYPEVLRMLDTNIEWTWALGEAVLGEQAAVMDAIQLFRRQAMQAGNLASDSQQTVTDDGALIEIAPADPEVIYIPYYEPERVVVVQPRPVIHYYADPYPLYYYPYPIGYRFSTGLFWGVTTAFHIGWHSHNLHVYHHRHHSHPYYGRSYYTPYYARRGVNININVNRVNSVWSPRQRRAARPHRVNNNGTQVTRSRERSNNTRTTSQRTTRTRPQQANRATVQTQGRSGGRNPSVVTAPQNTNRATVRTQGRRPTTTAPNRQTRGAAVPAQRPTSQQRSSSQQRPITQQRPASNTNRPRTSMQTQRSATTRQTRTQRAPAGNVGASRAAPARTSSPARSVAPARSSTQNQGSSSSSRRSRAATRNSARSGQSTQNGRTHR